MSEEKKPTKERGLFKRADSPFWWISYKDENGKIVRVSTEQKSKETAKDILSKKRTLVAEGRHLDIKRIPKTPFHDLCTQYWETRGQHLRMKGVDSMIKIWKGMFGNPTVNELSTATIEKALNDRMLQSKPHNPKSKTRFSQAARNRHATMLKAMFNWGIQENLVATNPLADIEMFEEKSRARIKYLDQDEIKRLYAAASDDFRPFLILAINTGMRRGEIFNLRWSDVDLQNDVLTVRESKSGKPRTIPLNQTVTALLSNLSSRFQKGYVFPSPYKEEGDEEQRPLTDINHTFRRVTKKAKLDEIRFHDLRHTFASHLVMSGVDLRTVQELLGHSSITMTMRYAHLAPSHRIQAVRKLDAIDLTYAQCTLTARSGNSVSAAPANPLN